MRKIRKRLLPALLAGLLLLGMTGCSGGSGSDGSIRLMVWSPSEDQSKDSGEWLQTCCNNFAAQHPEWDITFVYGVADEATAANTVAQDPTASADVFMYANDNLTVLTDAQALAKLGGIYADEVASFTSQALLDSVTMDGYLYGVPFTTNTWYMYYDKRVFSEEDVKSLDAMLDGCSRWQIFTKITLPLSKPIVVYSLLTSFINPWVDFIFAKVICQANADQYTIAIGLWRMLEKEYIDNWNTSFAAGAVLISIPIALLFLKMQKYYVNGTSGAVKG